MGMFDSLHTGDRCAQVKCLGKTLADYIPGDSARLHRIATDAELVELGEPPQPSSMVSTEELRAWSAHPHTRGWADGFVRDEVSWQIPMGDRSHALFIDGVFRGFVDAAADGVLVVDVRGRDVRGATSADQVGFVTAPDDCRVCAELSTAL